MSYFAIKRTGEDGYYIRLVLLLISSSTVAQIELDSLYKGIDYSVTITRAKFENMCASLFAQTLDCVEKVLKDSKLSKTKIDEIVLVGGSTRIPKVQELLPSYPR